MAAVGEGRRIYANIQRFVRSTFRSDAGEICVMLVGPMLGLPLPLLAVEAENAVRRRWVPAA